MVAPDSLAVREAAWAAYQAGFCVVPPKEDGSKAPLGEWKEYQDARPAEGQLRQWYADGRQGVGLVTGKVSRNLELFEFDAASEAYGPFVELARAAGLGDVVERIEAGYLEQSPSGGKHWLYRCSEITGNTKLAERPKRPGEKKHPKDNSQVLIETRGERGYAIVAPSFGRVHETGHPYELLQGAFDTIAAITPEERTALWELARTFDQMPRKERPKERARRQEETRAGGRPGDDFNARSTWPQVLEPQGWERVYERGEIGYWRRPGKERGLSATTGFGGDWLYVFSTSTEFEAQQTYTKFAAYALLNHGGDYAAAARALAGQGFGSARHDALQTGGNDGLLAQGGGVRLRRMADVASEAVTWLWHPYIPLGKLTLLEGDPGVGKSWVALAIATAVSLGRGLPGQASGEPCNVLLASAEDGLGDTIRPRLDAMGADVSRIHAIDGPLTFDDVGFLTLESAIVTVRPRLLVLDPLVAYLGGGVDIHRANEVRHVMANLARLADTYGLAVLPVRHLTKGGASKPIYRGLGSIDFTAACRSVLLAGHAADNPQARGLVHIKSNLAPIGPAIGYELRDGHFYWTGESLLTAADILAADDGAGASALEEAVGFVTAQLAAGPVLATQVWGDAHDAGLKDRTVNRAKAKMGVVTHRQGSAGKRGGGGFVWHLPGDLHCQDCHI